METPVTTHHTRAATHPDPDCAGVFQPRCSCGWRGELTASESDAAWLAEAHRRYELEGSTNQTAAAVETPLERAMRDGGEEI